MRTSIRKHKGKYKKKELEKVLDQTRLTEENKEMVRNYLCKGITMTDLAVSKQAAWNRISLVVKLIEANNS